MRPEILALLAAILSIAFLGGAVVVLRAGAARRAERRLGELVRGPSQLSDGKSALSLELGENAEPAGWQRMLVWLGHAPHLPPGAGVSLPLVIMAGLGAGLAAGVGAGFLFTPPVGIIAGVSALLFTVRVLLRLATQRHRDALFQQLPDAIGLIVRALRAGLPLNEALRTVSQESPSPTREGFERVVSQLGIGQPADQALLALGERTGLPEYNFFAITVGLQAQTGGNLAETLDNLGELTHQRVALRGRVRALTAEARLSAKILVALPIVCGTAMSILVPGNLSPLFNSPSGQRMLGFSICLLIIGVLTMRAMLRNVSEE